MSKLYYKIFSMTYPIFAFFCSQSYPTLPYPTLHYTTFQYHKPLTTNLTVYLTVHPVLPLQAWAELSVFLQEFVENNFGRPGMIYFWNIKLYIANECFSCLLFGNDVCVWMCTWVCVCGCVCLCVWMCVFVCVCAVDFVNSIFEQREETF